MNSLLIYQQFLSIGIRRIDYSLHYHHRMVVVLGLLLPLQSAGPFHFKPFQKLHALLEKGLFINRYYQALFEGLATDPHERPTGLAYWSEVALEEQRILANFLENHNRQIEGQIKRLALCYPHPKVPGFYFVAHLKKIMQRLWTLHQHLGATIECFERGLSELEASLQSRSALAFAQLLEYCHYALKISTQLKPSHSDPKKGPLQDQWGQ